MERLVLHEYAPSGNCYKIRLTAALLGIEIERLSWDILKGETRTPRFMAAINPNGRIPVLQIGGRRLPESNAACVWLAYGSTLIPTDRFDHADVLHWMFFEQYNHEANVATLRFWRAFIGENALSDAQRAQIPDKLAAGSAALELMDTHLATKPWLVGEGPTLADIALYAYTHVAEEGGFDLRKWMWVGEWCDRIAALPGYVPIDA